MPPAGCSRSPCDVCSCAVRAGEGGRESGEDVFAVVAGEGETWTACDDSAPAPEDRLSSSTLQCPTTLQSYIAEHVSPYFKE